MDTKIRCFGSAVNQKSCCLNDIDYVAPEVSERDCSAIHQHEAELRVGIQEKTGVIVFLADHAFHR